ncbi:DUF4091 domain-containing protein [Paenibacillus sp. MER TA 81-3]|uniref:DUF4091 domain-containing protein n=1 Tax=Paenibacillus sp. MER TA 81-3 TaxID=2939573 RepID=UPI002040D36F|nr:DUF4091 domain-containing protein [Paenibacillus sp. MER TA 81-3]MCM3337963.1 DUF4091 domain-containing protein [Paenibacillus sp. MER TA 81-3]
MTNNALDTRIISSLIKVFADEPLQAPAFSTASALQGESFHFQLAYHGNELMKHAVVKVQGGVAEAISVQKVELVPSELPIYAHHDNNLVRSTPGLYPDLLTPIHEQDGIVICPGQWRSLWISLEVDVRWTEGEHPITVSIASESGELLGEETFTLVVIPTALPKQQLMHTEWLHCDGIATYYGVDIFSEAHWDLIRKFVRTAVQHGINMILTPLFTPPLDTEVGGERPTVQLVDVKKEGERYSFGFERLDRWVRMCLDEGVEYFEMSHLFSQWGAKHAPKIIASVDGEEQRIFGWETDAAGPEYRAFLRQFLTELVAWLKAHRIADRSHFHISDEPRIEQMESYRQAVEAVSDLLAEFPVMDALSDYDFYRSGLVQVPVPANNHVEPFIEHGVKPLWTYYCCSQYREVSNRFFSMPSARNRILGWQLYKFQVDGFLHWGYNFYYSQYSRKRIDPFRTTDALYAFPSGDAFLVYPGEEGPLESIRLYVLREALQDLRALQLLESYIGHEAVIALIEDNMEEALTFHSYPHSAEWLLNKRALVNERIREAVCGTSSLGT